MVSMGFWTLSIVRNSKYPKTTFRKHIKLPKHCVCYLEFRIMDKVQRLIDSECLFRGWPSNFNTG
jgi:hypothetical protein